tara:strand:+ start:127 stop:1230 length:1104 start_codon:yes stop_codon:yes gene_type:complete
MAFVPLDFPREVLEIGSDGKQGGRYIVRSWTELERYWRGKNGSGNAYFTAYGYRATQAPRHHRVDYDTPVIHHFILDFDCKDFKQRGAEVEFDYMQQQVRRLHAYLLEQDLQHYVWFSGGGFHVWVPLSQTYMPTSASDVRRIKEGGRLLMREWHNKLELGCSDPAVAFDTSGMIRIPNSYNARRACWSIPLSSEEIMTCDYDDLDDIAQDPRPGYIEHGSTRVSITLPERRNNFKANVEKVEDLPDVTLDDIIVLPCLSPALGMGNPTHRQRLHLVSYLAARLRWFFRPEAVTNEDRQKHIDEICGIIERQGWVDYDAHTTRVQVESIIYGGPNKTGLSAPRCSTIENDGMCVGKCRYHDGTIVEA